MDNLDNGEETPFDVQTEETQTNEEWLNYQFGEEITTQLDFDGAQRYA